MEECTYVSKHRSTLSDIKSSMQSCSRAISCMSLSSPCPICSHSSNVSGSTSAMVFKMPLCPGSPYQTAPVQLQAGRGQSLARPRPSSSQETAGRAGRAGQAAQEKPCLVPPLPPRAPGDEEARGSPERRQPARVSTPARGSSDPAVQSRVLAELPAAAGRGRVHRQAGGGRRRGRPSAAGRGGW